MGKLVTTTELASLLGVSRQTLGKAVKDGRLSVADRDAGKRPLFNPAIAGKEWADWTERASLQNRQHEGKSRGGRPAKVTAVTATPITTVPMDAVDPELPTDFSDFADLMRTVQGIENNAQRIMFMEAAKKVWDTRNSMLRALRDDGTLVPVQQVKADGADLGTVLIGALMAFPDRIADRLAAMSDARAIHVLLMDEVNIIIREIRKKCDVPDVDGLEE
ncbi:MAG: helix-turn-helix domain-containing protein [Planctomycetaceae bacterium]|nr:helix-turn-helix domain-containing protein [Planctomycetaceae bacterium]